jgi:carbonic anhydrase/acetyltransferase-like protein (isoleucine patch superfamily)
MNDFGQRHPEIHHATFVAEGARLIGRVIPRDSIVADGSLVPPGKAYPEGSLILGSPATVARKLTEEEVQRNKESAIHYRWLWEAYLRNGIGRIPR